MDESRQAEELAKVKILPQPSFEIYKRRQKLLQGCGGLGPEELPELFPTRFNGPSVWASSDVDLDDSTVRLSTSDVSEIEVALAEFKSEWYKSEEHCVCHPLTCLICLSDSF